MPKAESNSAGAARRKGASLRFRIRRRRTTSVLGTLRFRVCEMEGAWSARQGLRKAPKGQMPVPPARMLVAVLERKRLSEKAQTERHSGGCTAMPSKVRHTTVPGQQRQSVLTVLEQLKEGRWDLGRPTAR